MTLARGFLLAALSLGAAAPLAACSASSSPATPADAGTGGGNSHDAGSTTDGAPGGDTGAASHDGGTPPKDGGSDGSGGGTGGETGPAEGGAPGRQSLIWMWMDYASSLATLAANAQSFTHVSPSLYDLNYAYTSGVAQTESGDGSDDFDGLSSSQIASKVHAAGMKCVPLIQAGAANTGTDQGIQNILSDAPAGTQAAFLSAMVGEAVAKGYDGYSLDWEIGGGTDYATYGKALVSFLGAFQSALHAKGMVLQLIVGSWFVEQSDCSGDTGLVDLKASAAVVDQVIMMAYDTSLGSPTTACDASVKNPQACGGDFASDLGLMCAYVPVEKISIGFDSDPKNGNNPIAGSCVSATQAAGIPAVAIWPEYNTAGPGGSYALCDTTNIAPSGATWFDLLKGFLAGP